MKTQSTLLGPLLQYFFVDYLCTQKGFVASFSL